jgi:hypothetical protein
VKKAGSEPTAWPGIWWDRWRNRITRFFRDDTTSFPPYWSDVVARAAGSPAAAQLNLDLTRMTMGAWSELLLLALQTAVASQTQPPSVVNFSDLLSRPFDLAESSKTKRDEATWGRILGVVATEVALAWPASAAPPTWDATAPWLAIPAVDRLGLGQQVEKPWREALTTMEHETASWVTGSFETKRWRERPAIGYGIAASDSSIMKSWPAPVRYGGILLERSRWLAISKPFEAQESPKPGATKDTSSPCIVLVEPGRPELNENLDENEIRPARRLVEWIGESSSTWLYVVPTTAPEAERSDRIVIRGPQDFDDAMDRAIRTLTGASKI